MDFKCKRRLISPLNFLEIESVLYDADKKIKDIQNFKESYLDSFNLSRQWFNYYRNKFNDLREETFTEDDLKYIKKMNYEEI